MTGIRLSGVCPDTDISLVCSSLQKFRAAAKLGHREAQWVAEVTEGMGEDEWVNIESLRRVFEEEDTPLGWYLAGRLSAKCSRHRFLCFKKSSEGGCLWGQVEYVDYIRVGVYNEVEPDVEKALKMWEEAAVENNALALDHLGYWYRYWGGRDIQKARFYFQLAAERGVEHPQRQYAEMCLKGDGGASNWIEAVKWSAKLYGYTGGFWGIARTAMEAWSSQTKYQSGDLTRLVINDEIEWSGDLTRLVLEIGKGMYWHMDGDYHNPKGEIAEFAEKCLDYYCDAMDLQQQSLLLFLLFWKKKTAGLKDVGKMIAEVVWQGRYECVVTEFEPNRRRSARLKRLKK
jgi:hypothetical protein